MNFKIDQNFIIDKDDKDRQIDPITLDPIIKHDCIILNNRLYNKSTISKIVNRNKYPIDPFNKKEIDQEIIDYFRKTRSFNTYDPNDHYEIRNDDKGIFFGQYEFKNNYSTVKSPFERDHYFLRPEILYEENRYFIGPDCIKERQFIVDDVDGS